MTQHPDWYGALGRRVFLRRDLDALLEALKADGVAPRSASLNRLLAALEEAGGLREEIVPAAGALSPDRLPYRPAARYVLGEATAEDLAVALRPGATCRIGRRYGCTASWPDRPRRSTSTGDWSQTVVVATQR